MIEAERYAALRALYLQWFARTASYAGARITEAIA